MFPITVEVVVGLTMDKTTLSINGGFENGAQKKESTMLITTMRIQDTFAVVL